MRGPATMHAALARLSICRDLLDECSPMTLQSDEAALQRAAHIINTLCGVVSEELVTIDRPDIDREG